MKDKEKHYYMGCAINAAQMSHAERKKVGSCVVTKNRGIYIGYNGSLPGQDNSCELKDYMSVDAGGWLDPEEIYETWPYVDDVGRYKLVTKNNIVHAEMNALSKMLKEGISAEGSTLFVSLSPCTSCALMIASSGTSKVIYQEEYRDTAGLEILIDAGVEIEKYIEI